jgi:tripeptide aminopeptidase
MPDTVLDRLLRYVVIDTQSDPNSNAQPSTDNRRISAACWSMNC